MYGYDSAIPFVATRASGLSYMRTIHIRFPMTPTKSQLGYAKNGQLCFNEFHKSNSQNGTATFPAIICVLPMTNLYSHCCMLSVV